MEYFYEQFQSKDYKDLDKKLNLVGNIIIGLAIISIFTLQIALLIINILLFIGIKFYKFKSVVEYEYELTSYDLSISKIINKSKRKEIISVNIKEIISIKDISSNFNEKCIIATLEDIGIKKQVIKIKLDNKIINIKLALDENLIGMIKRINPIAFY